MLPSIIFNKGQGGLGRPLAGEDFVSGLIFYTADDNLPSGWSSTHRVKPLFSVEDAIHAGILSNYNKNDVYGDSNFPGAAVAHCTITVDAVGDTNEVITIVANTVSKVTDASGVASVISKPVTLCTYKQLAGDTSGGVNVLAGHLATAIEANKAVTGFSASAATDTITITSMHKWLGAFLNGQSPVVTNSDEDSELEITITAFTGGVQSLQAVWFYHISEYFRLQPKGQLYVGFFEPPVGDSPYTFSEITTMQNHTGGKIRQVGIFVNDEFDSGHLGAIHTEIVTNNDNQYQPLSALYAADISGMDDLADELVDLTELSANKVSAVIGQDGAGWGALLYLTNTKSITCLGAALGATSFAAVSDDIGWIQKFNLSNGTELDTPAFANGELLNSKSQGYWTAVDNLRYIFVLKYRGNAGSYFNDSHCAITVSSDYAYIENNRTIDKANRGIYASVLPYLKGPLLLNTDGSLADTTIAYLTSLAGVNLTQMVSNTELSGFQVIIDSKQNVQSTGNLKIAVQLLGIGVARNITVNIGFVLALTGGQ